MSERFPFQRLQNDLAALIARTPAGERLLNEPELSKKLGVSRATLREAMRTFETQGLIRRRQGSGTYVVKVHKLESGLETLESVETIAKRQGLAISVSDLEAEEMKADKALAEKLSVSTGAKVTRVRRVIRTTERPVAYLVDFLPATVFSAKELPENFRGSLLNLLLERGDVLKSSRAEVTAIGATAEVGKAMEVQRGDVLLHFLAQLYNAEGKVVDYSMSYFIPGYFNFHIVRKVGK